MKAKIIMAALALATLLGVQTGTAHAAMGKMPLATNHAAAEALTKVGRRHGRGHRHRGHRRYRWKRHHHFRPYFYVGRGCRHYWRKWKYTGRYYWLKRYRACKYYY